MNEPSSVAGASSVVPEEIRQLLERRQTYEEWLNRLDDVGDQYRPEVAERVRADYRERLGEVAGELAGHRSGLESALDERRTRLGELAEGFERRSAELEEAELRFKVGEFDEAKWDQQREGLTSGLEDIEAELDGARRAVEELEDVLGRLGEAWAPAVMAGATIDMPAEEEPAAGGDVELRVVEADPDIVPLHAEATDDEVAEDDDATPAVTVEELEPEEESEPEAELEPVEAADGSPPADGRGDGGSDDYLDELEFLESLSLDDPDTFDAVSRMLDEEEDH